jgi:biopolymer transport protein ExbD
MKTKKPMHYLISKLSLGFAFIVFLTLTWPSSHAAAQLAISKSNASTQQPSRTLQQIVKIIVNRETNQITLIGNPTDIAIVKQTIEAINRVNRQPPATIVGKKVVLYRQLSESVATAIRNAQPILTSGQGKLTITALHTPEAIFLSGPTALVERAEKFIATLDR